MGKISNLALGSYEAAALMGVHFTRPARMYRNGKIDGREIEAISGGGGARQFIVYSAASCEEDYRQYERQAGGRPRDWLHLRDEAVRRASKAEPPILYDDAIGVLDAAKLLKVHYTAVYKLVERGKLVARKPWNPRRGGSRVLIVSRKSCEANRREVAALEKQGKKRGRKRYA
jgi:hypothetical protein